MQIERVEKNDQVAYIMTRLSDATEKSSRLLESVKAHSKRYLEEGNRVVGLWLRSIKRKFSVWSSKVAEALNDFLTSEKV